ncbi:hypothetical protein IWX84_002896 [Flavobacterium sp. CG_9.10]|uniref:hypothetical protein n=1 Tax=Flavobacterium sp. CG_9.10 TaxID=2787729 RepID=UPI0018CA3F61|nr:hypothetical protein [Flavobacterium sp. CG_9.10]MBG6112001.1 hypothetical protein [Flavobacterium sp. CG_9.10]
MVILKNIISRNKIFERLSITTVLSLILALFISCAKDEIFINTISKSLEISIDNENLKLTNSSISSNESCNNVFVSCRYESPKDAGFRIEFRLTKSGALRNIRLFDYRNGNSHFESADFNPKGLIAITNFSYDETKKYLHFDFKGELLEQAYGDELDVAKKRKFVEGSITITDVRNTQCTSFTPNLIFETTNLRFLSNDNFGSNDSTLKTNPYQFFFYSDNGYRTIFRSNKDLWNLEKGTYTFDQNTIENRIDFEQYIGIFRATQLLWIRDIEWKKFQTSGCYTIKEHVMINGLKVTKGEMALQVYDNGILLYSSNNGTFEVTGFN